MRRRSVFIGRAMAALVPLFACGVFANAEGPVPDSLRQAHDVVEARLWMRVQAQRLSEFCWQSVTGERVERDPATIQTGAWPSNTDYTDTLVAVEEAFNRNPKDWRTLAEGLGALDALTPGEVRLQSLCIAVATAPLPEQIDRSRFYAIQRSLDVLAKQRTSESVAFLSDWTREDKWLDLSSTMSFVTNPARDTEKARQEAKNRLRLAGFQAVARYVEPEQASNILEERRLELTKDPSFAEEIEECLATIQDRMAGNTSRFRPRYDDKR